MITLERRRPKNPSLNYDPEDPDWLVVRTADCQAHRAERAFPLGAPQCPMSFDQIAGKFETNAGREVGDLAAWDEAIDIRPLLAPLGALS